jgi:hypothetical protein
MNYFRRKNLFPRTPPEGRPDLPPLAVLAAPAFHKTFDRRFKLDWKDQKENYTLHAALALNSAPSS